MIREDRIKVLQGFVNYHNQWISAEKKAEVESQRRKKIEQGYVLYQGEWITIEEKLARVSSSMQERQPTIINETINRQVYNIQNTTDNRTFQSNVHEHRHVHVDQPFLSGSIDYSANRQKTYLENEPRLQSIQNIRQDQQALALKKEYLRLLEDMRRGSNPSSDDAAGPKE